MSLQGGSQVLRPTVVVGGAVLMRCCLLGALGGFLLPAHLCFPSPCVSLPLLIAVPPPFPAPRLSVFEGDYAVLTLEYELVESGSQILELGKAGAQAAIQEWLEHLCPGCSRCLTLPPTRKRPVPEPQTSSATAKIRSSACQPGPQLCVSQTWVLSALSVLRPRRRQTASVVI